MRVRGISEPPRLPAAHRSSNDADRRRATRARIGLASSAAPDESQAPRSVENPRLLGSALPSNASPSIRRRAPDPLRLLPHPLPELALQEPDPLPERVVLGLQVPEHVVERTPIHS